MSRSDNSRRGVRPRFDDFRAAGRRRRDREEVATAARSIAEVAAAQPRRDGECPRCGWITGRAACPRCGSDVDGSIDRDASRPVD